MRSLAALLLLTSTALAAPQKKEMVLSVAAKIARVVDSEGKLDAAAVAPALDAVRADLDRCAKQSKVKATATLTFEKGTVAIAAPSDAFGACIAPPLKKVAVKGGGKVVVVNELAVIETAIDELLARDTRATVAKLDGIKSDEPVGYGRGTGAGLGSTSKGPGAGNAHGDFVSHGKLDTGLERLRPHPGSFAPKSVSVVFPGAAELGGYDREDIDRVMKSRAGIFRACYQKELNRNPQLAGKVTFRFEIDGDGAVRTVATTGTTLHSTAVEECLRSNVMRLKFPKKGVGAVVVYPMAFSAP